MDIAMSSHDTISGKITDFVGQNGDDLVRGSVELMAASFTGGKVFPTADASMAVMSVVEWVAARSPPGRGVVNSSATPTQPTGHRQLLHPLSVAGEFDAHSSHGHGRRLRCNEVVD